MHVAINNNKVFFMSRFMFVILDALLKLCVKHKKLVKIMTLIGIKANPFQIRGNNQFKNTHIINNNTYARLFFVITMPPFLICILNF